MTGEVVNNDIASEGSSNTGLSSPKPSHMAEVCSEKTTPESVGTMVRNGKRCGDSGYAMEEELLGGRIRHRHSTGGKRFQVEAHSTVLALCGVKFIFVQVERLILIEGEPSTNPTEMWLSDEYVEEMLTNLKAGLSPFLGAQGRSSCHCLHMLALMLKSLMSIVLSLPLIFLVLHAQDCGPMSTGGRPRKDIYLSLVGPNTSAAKPVPRARQPRPARPPAAVTRTTRTR
jgi:hypothetical protein